jgi:hypothetical protein
MEDPMTDEPPVVTTANEVQITRARVGLWMVVTGDTAIAIAAVLGILIAAGKTTAAATVVSILSSAFTAISTMTTAYFGIRAASNTAESSIARHGPPDAADESTSTSVARGS